MSQKTTPTIYCSDGCGRSVPEDEVLGGGWTYLEIQKRYRCNACVRALEAVNKPREDHDNRAEDEPMGADHQPDGTAPPGQDD